jgi:hypothetical protein
MENVTPATCISRMLPSLSGTVSGMMGVLSESLLQDAEKNTNPAARTAAIANEHFMGTLV